MKWTSVIQFTPGAKVGATGADLAKVEALRGIAEQLERIGDRLALEKWKRCNTHGDIDGSKEWGCPECVRELREELARGGASLT